MLENIFFVLHDNASNVCGLTIECLIAVDAIVIMWKLYMKLEFSINAIHSYLYDITKLVLNDDFQKHVTIKEY